MTINVDPALLAPIEKVACFLETGNVSLLSAFANKGVAILENFPPHLFEGEEAVKVGQRIFCPSTKHQAIWC